MREKFLNFADDLLNHNGVEKIYSELSQILAQNVLFHEEGACYEKLWHLNRDFELYKKIGDIFANKVQDYSIALSAYNKYLQYSDPAFFKNYEKVVKKLGYNYLDNNIDTEDCPNEIVELYDVFDAIIYMIICLHQNKDYEGVILLEKKLESADNKIQEYICAHPEAVKEDYKLENEASRKHLSQILSQTLHHNDINTLAIKYDKNNRKAYINIIGDYITYKKYDEAIEFYKNKYSEALLCKPAINIINICWDISNFYSNNFDFYNAVLFQKYALELELTEE